MTEYPRAVGFGPVSAIVNSVAATAEEESLKVADTSNLSFETSNLTYHTKDYMNEIVDLATNAADSNAFLSDLYNAFNGKSNIQ
jgi:hypothetical protein